MSYSYLKGDKVSLNNEAGSSPASAELRNIIIAYFTTQNHSINLIELCDDHTNLFENGVLDSLGLVGLLAYLESEFGIQIADDDFEIAKFSTINAITDLVRKYINNTSVK